MQSSILAQPRQLCVTISHQSLPRAFLQTAAGQSRFRPTGAPCDFSCLQQRKCEEFLLSLLLFILTKGSLTSASLFYKQALAVIKTCSKHSTMSSMFLHPSKSSLRWPGMIFFLRAIVSSACALPLVIAGYLQGISCVWVCVTVGLKKCPESEVAPLWFPCLIQKVTLKPQDPHWCIHRHFIWAKRTYVFALLQPGAVSLFVWLWF